MESRKRRFDEAFVLTRILEECMPYADLVTGYALRRTRRSLKSSLKDANEQATESIPELKEYMEILGKGKTLKEADEICPTGRAPYDELMKTEIEFDVHTCDPSTLEKPWPHRNGEREKTPPADLWLDLLEGLEMIRKA